MGERGGSTPLPGAYSSATPLSKTVKLSGEDRARIKRRPLGGPCTVSAAVVLLEKLM